MEKRPLAAFVPACLACATVYAVWRGMSFFPQLEELSVDWRFLMRGPSGERLADIVLVLVEEEANLEYRNPIPREHLARVIENLGVARLIGLDIILDRRSFDKQGDERLRQALRANGKVVAVSYLDAGKEHLPDRFFRDELLDVGYATLSTSQTDVYRVRRGTLIRELEQGRALSFAGALFAHATGLDPDELRQGQLNTLPDGREVEGSLLINFTGPPSAVYRREGKDEQLGQGGFKVVFPSHPVAAGVLPQEIIKDKIVLVGSGLDDTLDRFPTPFTSWNYGYEKMLGVEIHAHLLRTLLQADYLSPWSQVQALALTWLLALGIALVVILTTVPRSFAALLLLLAGLWVAGFALFNQTTVVLPLILPSLGLIATHGLSTAYFALTEGREKRHTRQLFDKYLSPELIDSFLEDRSLWVLGGQKVDITVIFADLEGFTPLSERLPPEELVEVMNQYLTDMTDAILRLGGTIDKYEGDLVMAFFGAPMPQLDHAERACRAAVLMQKRLAQLSDSWLQRGFPKVRMRIGVNSGLAVVGNMGSDFRFNYTAMGDTVNLAARLEDEANKKLGTYTLVSERTCQQAGPGFVWRDRGKVEVKGKSEPIQVFELVGLEGEGNTTG